MTRVRSLVSWRVLLYRAPDHGRGQGLQSLLSASYKYAYSNLAGEACRFASSVELTVIRRKDGPAGVVTRRLTS